MVVIWRVAEWCLDNTIRATDAFPYRKPKTLAMCNWAKYLTWSSCVQRQLSCRTAHTLLVFPLRCSPTPGSSSSEIEIPFTVYSDQLLHWCTFPNEPPPPALLHLSPYLYFLIQFPVCKEQRTRCTVRNKLNMTRNLGIRTIFASANSTSLPGTTNYVVVKGGFGFKRPCKPKSRWHYAYWREEWSRHYA